MPARTVPNSQGDAHHFERGAEVARRRWIELDANEVRSMARRSKISPEKFAALKATIMAYATELELRGFSRRQIAMGMFGKALELLVDELEPDEGKSELLRALIHAAETHLDVGPVQR